MHGFKDDNQHPNATHAQKKKKYLTCLSQKKLQNSFMSRAPEFWGSGQNLCSSELLPLVIWTYAPPVGEGFLENGMWLGASGD